MTAFRDLALYKKKQKSPYKANKSTNAWLRGEEDICCVLNNAFAIIIIFCCCNDRFRCKRASSDRAGMVGATF